MSLSLLYPKKIAHSSLLNYGNGEAAVATLNALSSSQPLRVLSFVHAVPLRCDAGLPPKLTHESTKRERKGLSQADLRSPLFLSKLQAIFATRGPERGGTGAEGARQNAAWGPASRKGLFDTKFGLDRARIAINQL